MCGQLELTSTNLTKISATSSKTSSSGQHTTNRKFICQFTSARCAFREHTAITPPWGSACRLSGLLLAAATPHALLPLPLHRHYTAITLFCADSRRLWQLSRCLVHAVGSISQDLEANVSQVQLEKRTIHSGQGLGNKECHALSRCITRIVA